MGYRPNNRIFFLEQKMLPHLNPAIDPNTRFRLRLQLEVVRKLVEGDPRRIQLVAHSPGEVRRYRRMDYGWEVLGKTVEALFAEQGIPWDSEDEEKVAEGWTRGAEACRFWQEWMAPPQREPPAPPPRLPLYLTNLIMRWVPKVPKRKVRPWPKPKPYPWWHDPRAYGDRY
jgi:hypothetical protein